jgi:hypothetical protein
MMIAPHTSDPSSLLSPSSSTPSCSNDNIDPLIDFGGEEGVGGGGGGGDGGEGGGRGKHKVVSDTSENLSGCVSLLLDNLKMCSHARALMSAVSEVCI